MVADADFWGTTIGTITPLDPALFAGEPYVELSVAGEPMSRLPLTTLRIQHRVTTASYDAVFTWISYSTDN